MFVLASKQKEKKICCVTMSCVDTGLWHFLTNENNDIFYIAAVVSVLIETVAILFYVRSNRTISINSHITDRSVIINDYEDTVDDQEYERLAKKIKKANKNVILPVYYKIFRWFLYYEIIMIAYSLALLVLSINKIAINTVVFYIIIVFQGFLVNFFWYSFMYLILWMIVQKSSGTQAWYVILYFILYFSYFYIL